MNYSYSLVHDQDLRIVRIMMVVFFFEAGILKFAGARNRLFGARAKRPISLRGTLVDITAISIQPQRAADDFRRVLADDRYADGCLAFVTARSLRGIKSDALLLSAMRNSATRLQKRKHGFAWTKQKPVSERRPLIANALITAIHHIAKRRVAFIIHHLIWRPTIAEEEALLRRRALAPFGKHRGKGAR